VAKPTEVLPTWATDANYAAAGEAWDGQPTKVAPPAALRAEGYEPEARPAADYDNSWKNAVGAWFTYVDGVLDGTTDTDGTARTIVISPTSFSGFDNAGNSRWWNASGTAVQSVGNPAATSVDLREFLPEGAIITGLVGMVFPGAVRGAGSRMQIDLWEATHDWVAPLAIPASALIVSVEDSGAPGPVLELIDLAAGLPHTYDATKTLRVDVVSGTTAFVDTFYGLQLIFTDPGPRNF
jgi:hypothetical protein